MNTNDLMQQVLDGKRAEARLWRTNPRLRPFWDDKPDFLTWMEWFRRLEEQVTSAGIAQE